MDSLVKRIPAWLMVASFALFGHMLGSEGSPYHVVFLSFVVGGLTYLADRPFEIPDVLVWTAALAVNHFLAPVFVSMLAGIPVFVVAIILTILVVEVAYAILGGMSGNTTTTSVRTRTAARAA